MSLFLNGRITANLLCTIIVKRSMTITTAACQNASKKAAEVKREEFTFSEKDQVGGEEESSEKTLELSPSVPDAEEALERKDRTREWIERQRDVSRLARTSARNKLRRLLPVQYTDVEAEFLKDERFFRRILARYGRQSGVEPGVAWPNRAQLERMRADEAEFELSLEQKVAYLIESKKDALNTFQKLEKETDEALKKMPKQIESYYQKLARMQKTNEEKDVKNREMEESVRDHFGFKVEMRDPRVQETIKKLQEEKKAAEKNEKKEMSKKRKDASLLTAKSKTHPEKPPASS